MMKQFPQRHAYSIRSLLERRDELFGRKKAAKPEQVSSAKVVLLGRDLVRFWKVHAILMLLLYGIWALLGLRNNDYEFVITARTSKDMWLDIVCTQALFWLHICNTFSAVAYLFAITRYISLVREEGIRKLMKKCRKAIILVIFSSLTFYGIIACYREHNDKSTLNICPVIIFMIFSHMSSLTFKIDFNTKMKVLRKMTLSFPK